MALDHTDASFYRASVGAEIDPVLKLPGRKPWAIEVKRSLDPRPSKGFHSACMDVKPEAMFIVYRGAERVAISSEIEAIGLGQMTHLVAGTVKSV